MGPLRWDQVLLCGTCVESWVPLSMKPSVQPVITAMTERVSSPCCLKKVWTLLLSCCFPLRKLFTCSHMLLVLLSPGPGPYELRSERSSSSALGSRSSSISTPTFRPWQADKAGQSESKLLHPENSSSWSHRQQVDLEIRGLTRAASRLG